MKFTKSTISLLKEVQKISNSLHINAGTNLSACNFPSKTIVAYIDTKDIVDFEFDMCIHNMSRFNNILSLFDNPAVERNGETLTISENDKKIEYRLTEPSLVLEVPGQERFSNPFENVELSIQISEDVLKEVRKASNWLELNKVAIQNIDGRVSISAFDENNTTPDNMLYDITDVDYEDFKCVFSLDNLVLLNGDYEFSFAKSGKVKLSRWINGNATYYIVMDSENSEI